ncbi:hypothetical protein AB751O23_AI_00020 [Chlamydiales bacterium SCGC AB-751-O23]|nr:hypothetical protein AB751O23_AI_00020 [Chlamydiales bacterium SCGC AB-751-O23]
MAAEIPEWCSNKKFNLTDAHLDDLALNKFVEKSSVKKCFFKILPPSDATLAPELKFFVHREIDGKSDFFDFKAIAKGAELDKIEELLSGTGETEKLEEDLKSVANNLLNIFLVSTMRIKLSDLRNLKITRKGGEVNIGTTDTKISSLFKEATDLKSDLKKASDGFRELIFRAVGNKDKTTKKVAPIVKRILEDLKLPKRINFFKKALNFLKASKTERAATENKTKEELKENANVIVNYNREALPGIISEEAYEELNQELCYIAPKGLIKHLRQNYKDNEDAEKSGCLLDQRAAIKPCVAIKLKDKAAPIPCFYDGQTREVKVYGADPDSTGELRPDFLTGTSLRDLELSVGEFDDVYGEDVLEPTKHKQAGGLVGGTGVGLENRQLIAHGAVDTEIKISEHQSLIENALKQSKILVNGIRCLGRSVSGEGRYRIRSSSLLSSALFTHESKMLDTQRGMFKGENALDKRLEKKNFKEPSSAFFNRPTNCASQTSVKKKKERRWTEIAGNTLDFIGGGFLEPIKDGMVGVSRILKTRSLPNLPNLSEHWNSLGMLAMSMSPSSTVDEGILNTKERGEKLSKEGWETVNLWVAEEVVDLIANNINIAELDEKDETEGQIHELLEMANHLRVDLANGNEKITNVLLREIAKEGVLQAKRKENPEKEIELEDSDTGKVNSALKRLKKMKKSDQTFQVMRFIYENYLLTLKMSLMNNSDKKYENLKKIIPDMEKLFLLNLQLTVSKKTGISEQAVNEDVGLGTREKKQAVITNKIAAYKGVATDFFNDQEEIELTDGTSSEV